MNRPEVREWLARAAKPLARRGRMPTPRRPVQPASSINIGPIHPNESATQSQLSTEGLDAIFAGAVVRALDGVFHESG